ncbi:hypothetical protein EVAR_86164_1 [Eumeta japonica]|uniref:Uncharacterized protein n=1 Tax=Eumeta variegata TaxID=151549 RepID=A0A4C1Z2V5_EUMVA|nr:hypothetical protein EVAR_86164_1 [Eumeta japonica]
MPESSGRVEFSRELRRNNYNWVSAESLRYEEIGVSACRRPLPPARSREIIDNRRVNGRADPRTPKRFLLITTCRAYAT